VGTSTDSYTGGVTVDFQAKTLQSGDAVTLKNFTVLRFP
jgi:hypothetical protein